MIYDSYLLAIPKLVGSLRMVLFLSVACAPIENPKLGHKRGVDIFDMRSS